MRWTPGGRSRNLDDLRGQTGGGRMIGGRGMGIGGAVIALILSLVFGVNIFDGGGGGPVQTSPGAVDQPVTSTPQEEERMQFMSFILDDVQTTWTTLLPKVGEQYREARMAVFRDGVSTACGDAPAALIHWPHGACGSAQPRTVTPRSVATCRVDGSEFAAVR